MTKTLNTYSDCHAGQYDYDLSGQLHPSWTCHTRQTITTEQSQQPEAKQASSKPKSLIARTWVAIGDWLLRVLEDPVTLFTLVLSIFAVGTYVETAGLRRTAVKQAVIADRQTSISEVQTEILRKQLLAQGPDLAYFGYKVGTVMRADCENVIDFYKVRLTMKNFGKDVATRCAYRVGPATFIDFIENMAVVERDLPKVFSGKMFSLKGLPGFQYVSQDQTLDTDTFDILSVDLAKMYNKQVRCYIWCVQRYGSKSQDEKWFAETAMYLEFVANRNPLTLKALEQGGVDPNLFSVRSMAYRYREDHDEG